MTDVVCGFAAVCEAGQFIDETGVCGDCPEDTFQPEDLPNSLTQCHQCPSGTGTRSRKRTSLTDCERKVLSDSSPQAVVYLSIVCWFYQLTHLDLTNFASHSGVANCRFVICIFVILIMSRKVHFNNQWKAT